MAEVDSLQAEDLARLPHLVSQVRMHSIRHMAFHVSSSRDLEVTHFNLAKNTFPRGNGEEEEEGTLVSSRGSDDILHLPHLLTLPRKVSLASSLTKSSTSTTQTKTPAVPSSSSSTTLTQDDDDDTFGLESVKHCYMSAALQLDFSTREHPQQQQQDHTQATTAASVVQDEDEEPNPPPRERATLYTSLALAESQPVRKDFAEIFG